ncbi:MAG: NAD(P)-dependent oxidoreductase [Candidatus Njordarchaeum guaymaensis]
MRAFITAVFTESALELLEKRGITTIYKPWNKTKKVLSEFELLDVIDEKRIDILIVEFENVSDDVIKNSDLKIIAICRNDPKRNIDIEAANERGIPVIYTPGRNANAVAEHTINLILTTLRKVVLADRLLRSGAIHIENFEKFIEFYEILRGRELLGKTVGIIGLGKIGFRVARKLRSFGVRILVYDPYVSDSKIRCVGGKRVDLDYLLRNSDIVTIHVPPTSKTIDLIGRNEIEKMKPTAILINAASSVVVDEDALFDAIKEGKIAGAALDVSTEEPIDSSNMFLRFDNVVLTPHIGGATFETINLQSHMVAYDILRILDGKKPKFLYNPEVWKNEF